MAIKKVPVVAPFDLGRGIKRRDDIAKFEVDLNDYVDNATVVYKNGKLSTVAPCAKVTSLDGLDTSEGTLKKLGITCFYGKFKAGDESTAKGAPVQLGKTDVASSEAIVNETKVPEGVDLDFNGWQIATDAEITQYLYTSTTDGKQSGWTRSNESGMNPDGSVKDANAWGDWMYELNLPSKPILVSTAGAIEGDGSTTNPIKLEFNDTIVKGPDGKYGAIAKGGLDCAAIDALPEKPWKKGTVLLAKQDGECVRLAAFDSIFQEIGVGITADKTNSFTNEEYKVVVTVSNTGEGKNELTNLNIVGPANTEDYEIKDVTFTKSEADEVEQVNNLTYNIRGLKKGGTVKVKYTVVPKVLGNYQFTAAVNPNSALDKDLGNNNATLILNARTKSDPTYVPSVDCPLITATELDSNVVLQQLKSAGKSDIGGVQRTVYTIDQLGASNIFSRRNTLKGLRIRLDGASTVVGYSIVDCRGQAAIVNGNTTASNLVSGDDGCRIVGDHDFPKRGAGGYTFQDGILEITADVLSFAFSCRPVGNNCKWQSYSVFAVLPPKGLAITTSELVGATTAITKQWRYAKGVEYLSIPNKNSAQVIPSTDSYDKDTYVSLDVSRSEPAKVVDKLVVTVRAGTAASLKYTSTDNYAVTQVRGKTTITNDTITVAADAKATDSVNTQYIQVIVEE
jgi:hypothetical protein|nr:MAG TPA: hypothetical protein [Caudoviricetes sp.]